MNVKALLLIVAVLLAGCSGPESSLESCIAEYSQPGKTKQLVQAGYANCKVALDTAKHPIERSRAMCIARQVPAVNVEQGLRVLYSECEKKHPTPECATGQRFSFPADACADICNQDEIYRPNQYPECLPAPPPGFEYQSSNGRDGSPQPLQPLEDFDPFGAAAKPAQSQANYFDKYDDKPPAPTAAD